MLLPAASSATQSVPYTICDITFGARRDNDNAATVWRRSVIFFMTDNKQRSVFMCDRGDFVSFRDVSSRFLGSLDPTPQRSPRHSLRKRYKKSRKRTLGSGLIPLRENLYLGDDHNGR